MEINCTLNTSKNRYKNLYSGFRDFHSKLFGPSPWGPFFLKLSAVSHFWLFFSEMWIKRESFVEVFNNFCTFGRFFHYAACKLMLFIFQLKRSYKNIYSNAEVYEMCPNVRIGTVQYEINITTRHELSVLCILLK